MSMAVYISGTLVIDSSGNIPWSRIINRPSRVLSVNVDTTGDGTQPIKLMSLSYTTDTVTLHKSNACNCACACSTDTA